MKSVNKFITENKGVLSLFGILLGIVFSAGLFVGSNNMDRYDTIKYGHESLDKRTNKIEGQINNIQEQVKDIQNKIESLRNDIHKNAEKQQDNIHKLEIEFYKNKK